MHRHLNAAVAALAAALTLAGCQQAAPPAANSAPAPAAANAAPAPVAATGADAADAKAFLEGLYAHYKSAENNSFDLYDKDAPSVFDQDTLALMQTEKAALKGDAGARDADSVCTCQDFTGLTAKVTIVSITPTTAKAGVDFHDTGQTETNHIDYDLTKGPNGWRVHDIHSFSQPSFRASLNEDIKDAKSAPAG